MQNRLATVVTEGKVCHSGWRNAGTSLWFVVRVRQAGVRLDSGNCSRDIDLEHRSSPWLALHSNRSLVSLDDPMCDGQTQAGAAEFAAAGFIHTVKAFENSGLILRRDANAGVFDTDDNAALVVLVFLFLQGRERYFPWGRRVLQGIVEQNIDEAAQGVLVSHHMQRLSAQMLLELEITQRRHLVPLRCRLPQGCEQVDGMNVEGFAAGIRA